MEGVYLQMKNVLSNIRKPNSSNRNKKYLCLLLCIVLGTLMGTAAKYFDNTPIIGEVGTNFGIWIFLAALIACYSLGPILAGINVFFFFLSMLFAYYTYTYFFISFFTNIIYSNMDLPNCNRIFFSNNYLVW